MKTTSLILIAAAAAFTRSASAQSFTVDWYTIDNGGSTVPSTGGIFGVAGTIAQYDAGSAFSPMTGASFSVVGGFWAVALPRCDADWNNDAVINSQDFFDFLADFFSPTGADYNHDSVSNSQDFFDFLADFFAGCP